MKTVLAFLIIFSASIFAQNVKVTDYKVPVSTAKTLRFDGAWNWGQIGDSVSINNAVANLRFRTFYSSLPLAWFINVDAQGGKNYGNYNHDVVIDLSYRNYIWDYRDFFGFARLYTEHATQFKQIASDITLGFGYGRYINATALAKAVRIEGHLMKDKVIGDYLSTDVMINIANIIERESEYIDVFGDTYETYWFDDIEKEIERSDLLESDGIGSIGLLRMRQVLFGINERVNERYYGWDISAGILYPITTADKSPTGKPNLAILGRYAYPINWSLQVNSVAEVFTPIDSAFFKQIRVRSGVDFIYELSNMINLVSGYRLGIFKPVNLDAVIEHNLSMSFWYYLENNIYLTISGNLSKQGSNPRILSTRIGIQYNLF